MAPELLRFLRTSRNMTQQELAEKLGVSQIAITCFERGTRSIPEFREKQIREFFGDDYIEQAKQFLFTGGSRK